MELATALGLVVIGVVAYLSWNLRRERARADRERQLREFFAARGGRVRAAGSGGGPSDPASPEPPEEPQEAEAVKRGGRAPDAVGRLRSPEELPTFADVGGMGELKRELTETLGLVLRHEDAAAAYGIRWNGLLLHGRPGVGKTFLGEAIAGEFGLNLLHVSTGDLISSMMGGSAGNVQAVFAVAEANRPCLILFDEFDSVAQRRDERANPEERRTVNQLLTSVEQHRTSPGLVVAAATNDLDHLDPAVARPGRFDRHVRIDLPDRAARQAVFAAQLDGRPARTDAVDLEHLAGATEGLTPAAIAQLVDAAALAALREASERGEMVRITREHLERALANRGGRDRPTVEDWDWDRLVLPAHIREELEQLQSLVEDPERAKALGVSPPSGVLLTGPPGTGKTTVARILAAEAHCSFYPVSGADVTSKWVGESERSVRRLFDRARDNRPSIVFFDELDAIGSRRDGAGHGATERQLNQLLIEMDGVTSSRGILVLGATNRPDLLDPALLRGGRFSRTIRLELPDATARLAILRIKTRRMPTVGVDLEELAERTDGFSGADLKALCQQAALHALVRTRDHEADDEAGTVTRADFTRAIADRRESEVS